MEGSTANSTKLNNKTKEENLYKVIMYNDDYTTFEFVICILMSIFNKQERDAEEITKAIHKAGHGVAGLYTKEIAEQKSDSAMRIARSQGFPLICSIKPA